MRNGRSFFIVSLLFPFLFISGCAHVISKDLRNRMDPSLTFREVLQNPNGYKDKSVLWGGEIIETVNKKDRTTEIEVFQRPLGWRGEPKETLVSEGRFLTLANEYLDPYLYRKGRKITVAGKILGEKTKPLGEMDYRYPLVLGQQIYLWKEYYSGTYPYYFYNPWWYYPYWR